jgi:hypothetical protein
VPASTSVSPSVFLSFKTMWSSKTPTQKAHSAKRLRHYGRRQQGATEKIKRENDVHLRQLAKKSTYVPSSFFFFFKVRFWAFLGKGSSKTREKN